VLYNRAVVAGLITVWKGVVGETVLTAWITGTTVAVGVVAAVGTTLLAMWWLSGWQARRPIAALLGGRSGEGFLGGAVRRAVVLVAVLCLVAAVIIGLTADPGRGRAAAGAFFGAGALMLGGCLTLCYVGMHVVNRSGGAGPPGVATLAIRNCARHPRRSLTTVGMLACGVFLVVAVVANRHDPRAKASNRKAGTGGFALMGETTLPILRDLNTADGRRALGLDPEVFDGQTRFVHMRARDGGDASCLNLNRVATPRVLGVRPEEFGGRGAFSFVEMAREVDPERPWEVLERDLGEDTIPAVADQTVIEWGLGKSVGDTLEYVDDRGRVLNLKLVGGLANSIFQGSVVISERRFVERFGSVGGSRLLLVDTPEARCPAVSAGLGEGLADLGIEVVSTAERLAEFSAVENTYLSIFLALGGLGLALGSMGMGVAVLRNVMERRGEMALLRAVGFSRRALCRLVLWEHFALVAAGSCVGILAGIVAVVPALSTPGSELPLFSLAAVLVVVVVCGPCFAWMSARWATKGEMLDALRSE